MAIPPEVAALFPVDIRQRGLQYYRRGVVNIIDVDDQSITATVRGTEVYTTEIFLAPDTPLEFECTCPAWDSYGTCKHVWATLLAADAQRLLSFRKLARSTRSQSPSAAAKKPGGSSWKRQLHRIRDRLPLPPPGVARESAWPADRRILYIVDITATRLYQRGLVIELATQKRLSDERWGPPKQFALREDQWAQSPDPLDRQIAQMLVGAASDSRYTAHLVSRHYYLEPAAFDTTLRLMCETGRCRVRLTDEADPAPLVWDGEPWELRIRVAPVEADPATDGEALLRVEGWLGRGDERMSLAEAAILAPGLVIAHGTAAPVRDAPNHALLVALADERALDVPASDAGELLRELHALPAVPPIDLPESLGVREERHVPTPMLRVTADPEVSWQPSRATGVLSFDYDRTVVHATAPQGAAFDEANRRILRRDAEAELAAARTLHELGFREEFDYYRGQRLSRIAASRLPRAIATLVERGWLVETELGRVRAGGELEVEVTSGIDWFELRGGAAFGEARAGLPELLAALRQGDSTVTLSDGTIGILPDSWRDRLRALAGVADSSGSALRFTRSQVGLLDALLAAMPAAAVDEQFERARRELRSFEQLVPADPPPSFHGELREYQREGLAWLHFLQRFGFGGCLADDMGLG
jgi:hypothetical protein